MPSVAVIGGGPGGLSFCHAIETMKREDGVGDDVEVTCFERSSRPGGIWKSADPCSKTDRMNMYEELWTNGPSHNIEFPDYTFDEHFGRPVTVYMPRQEVLGYLIGRVTKNCPDFFEKYVCFGTEVANVTSHEGRFLVKTRYVETGETSEAIFDKVIWACGDNGKPYIPDKFKALFEGFKGHTIHSSETGNLENDFRSKRVLFIGGGYSAEDLALQACKLGVEKAYICTREEDSDATVINAWPENKVKVLKKQVPMAIGECGRSIKFVSVNWTWDDGFSYGDEISSEIQEIDTVVFCTGYEPNFDMLSEGLYPVRNSSGFRLEVPEDWKMPENSLTKQLGDVKPSRAYYHPDYTHPDLYEGILVANPNMMFVWTYASYFPLVAADASAWLLARYSNGTLEVPSCEEMKRLNYHQALEDLKRPYIRYYYDEGYHKAVFSLPGFDGQGDFTFESEWEEFLDDSERHRVHQLARRMRIGKYIMDLGDAEKLNKNGEALLHFDALSGSHRQDTTPAVIAKNPLKTFRDYDNASEFYSIHTGTKATPLCRLWVDIDEREVFDDEEKKNSS